MPFVAHRKMLVVALAAVFACVLLLVFSPKPALATPNCTNAFYVYILIYGPPGSTGFSTDNCWTSRRLIQYEVSNAHVWRICQFDPNNDENKGAPRRVYNDTNSRTHDLMAEIDAVDTCANESPSTTEIDIEYMAATTTSDPCDTSCWEYVGGMGSVGINEFFPELYWGPTVEVAIEPILNHWENGDYDAAPWFTAGTMDATPFLNQNNDNFFGDWPALGADVRNLCNATQPGLDMSIYIGSGYPAPRNKNPDTLFQHNSHGTNDLIDEVDSTMNSCVG